MSHIRIKDLETELRQRAAYLVTGDLTACLQATIPEAVIVQSNGKKAIVAILLVDE